MSRQKKDVGEYRLLEEIGRGTFSNVYKAVRKSNQEIVALKQIKKEINQKDLLLVKNEIEILKNIRSPNIIKFYGDFKQKDRWYLVFQYCPHGDLNQLLKKQGALNQTTTQMISFCISEALFHLHQNKIVHRDLKLANILINQQSEIKLADFGFSKNSQQQLMQTYCGTPITMAPQIIQRKGYNESCDTWSLGVITYQMIYGKPPFLPSEGKGFQDLAELIIKKPLQFPNNIITSEKCKQFLIKCLIKDPSKRPSINDVLKDPWIVEGSKRLKQQKCIFNKQICSELSLSQSPIFSQQSSCQQKIDPKQEVQYALRYMVESHYELIIKNLCLNNLKSIYRKCTQILNDQCSKLLPFLFLKKIRSLSLIKIKLKFLDKVVVIPLREYNPYIKIQTIMVDWLKQCIPDLIDKQVNLQKVISISIYDTLINLIQNPDQNTLKQKLQTSKYLIQLIDTFIGEGQVTLQLNSTVNQNSKREITNELILINDTTLLSMLNRHHCTNMKKQDLNKTFIFKHKYSDQKHEGSEYQQLQFVKEIINNKLN